MSITYDQVIDYITEAVEEYKGVASFKKSLSLFLEELEEDVLICKINVPPVMTEEECANQAFDKSLDKEFSFKTSRSGWLSDLSYHHKSYD